MSESRTVFPETGVSPFRSYFQWDVIVPSWFRMAIVAAAITSQL